MTIQNQIERARKAFEQISDYTQEQVDKRGCKNYLREC